MVNVAVMGYGTVGAGVVEVMERNKAAVCKKAGKDLHVKYILDIREFPGDPYEDRVVHDFDTILNDEDVQIVCETMGGVGAAYKFTRACLENGKSVCTSNKELVAKYGPELLKIARENNCNYLFEASVGGGIPIIRPINYCLTADELQDITGILNGTTNFILTKMEREGADFAEVLKEAQERGYAERNPEADIEGHDACRKIAILSSLMTGKNVSSEDIYTEGITKITAADFAYAAAAGKTIKLLAQSTAMPDGKLLAMVAPAMIDKDHPLGMVNDVFNAIFVTGNMVGETMYYGKGAGSLPTASAVVSDVIDCARHLGRQIMVFWDAENAELASLSDVERSFYVRVKAECADKLTELFGEGQSISVEGRDDAAFITPVMTESAFAAAAEKLGDALLSRIRLKM